MALIPTQRLQLLNALLVIQQQHGADNQAVAMLLHERGRARQQQLRVVLEPFHHGHLLCSGEVEGQGLLPLPRRASLPHRVSCLVTGG